jgi:hypothetical protein
LREHAPYIARITLARHAGLRQSTSLHAQLRRSVRAETAAANVSRAALEREHARWAVAAPAAHLPHCAPADFLLRSRSALTSGAFCSGSAAHRAGTPSGRAQRAAAAARRPCGRCSARRHTDPKRITPRRKALPCATRAAAPQAAAWRTVLGRTERVWAGERRRRGQWQKHIFYGRITCLCHVTRRAIALFRPGKR